MTIAAVVLAAGFGTRLAPLTDHTPKPLLEVGGRPVASHLLDRLREVRELTQTVVVINDRHRKQWKQWHNNLEDSASVIIESNGVLTEDQRAGAVADLERGLSRVAPSDWVLVVAGDNLIDERLQPHVDAAASAQCPVVLCRDLGDDVPAGRFGEITTDLSGVIVRFREKPAVPESPLAATCTYVLSGDCLTDLQTFLVDGNADSPGAFVGWLAERQTVLARPLTGRYFDIGNHETLSAARAGYAEP